MSTTRAAYLKQYRIDHLAHLQQYHQEWAQAHPEQIARYSREWDKAHPEQAKKMHRAATRESNVRVKIEVLTHYGPAGQLRCAWPNCDVVDVDMLSLDHINNNGAQDRRSAKNERGGSNTYWRVRNAGFPEGFQTLCCNHQRKKENLRLRELWT